MDRPLARHAINAFALLTKTYIEDIPMNYIVVPILPRGKLAGGAVHQAARLAWTECDIDTEVTRFELRGWQSKVYDADTGELMVRDSKGDWRVLS